MSVVSSEKCEVSILDQGQTISDFINNTIEELSSAGNEVPFSVGNLDTVVKQHLRWLHNLPRVKPFYAVKCNSTPAVIRTLSALGTGFDCASKNEIKLALSLGVSPDKIIYAHPSKPQSHVRYACMCGVTMMTFDSEIELQKISHCHPSAKLVLRIAVDDSKSLLRLSSKFGATLSTVNKVLMCAKELDLEVIGVSFHAGCICTDAFTYRQAIKDARHVFDIANSWGFKMTLLDIGGGFPGRHDARVTFEQIAENINVTLDEFFPSKSGVQIIAEPGQYFVDIAFTLAVTVIAKNIIVEEGDGEDDNPDKEIVYFINDGIYGSMSDLQSPHPIITFLPYPQKAVESSEQRYKSVIWGPTCDSKDKVIDNYWLPELYIGDWLLLDNMGAYTNSVATDFNGFERAKIYHVVTADTWKTLNLKPASGMI
ncbi:ornithine decarboxylase-like [Thalassophryne amazonica]|uniref:ornithine decarboxylase-like n=1 Tax=Thalassophryne amazonica TaxID=390379 RepID=UPI00147253E0|nr:ornithine decarboxylase-like [Thalassophryne amazonica]